MQDLINSYSEVKLNGKINGLIYCMVNTNLQFLHWCLNWSPEKTGRNPLMKLKHKELNSPTMELDQINSNYILNIKVQTILYMVIKE